MEPWYKFILYGTYDGFSRSTLGDDNLYLVLENGEKVEVPRCFVKNASDFIEKDKLKLKDVIARIKKFDLATKEVWTNEILNELGSDYGTLKYKAGYEQGKFDGATERDKVTVPQFVADYIKDAKYYECDLDDAFDHIADESEESEIYKWFYTLGNVDVFAHAWLDGYEVEKEKKYTVKFKNVQSGTRYLKYDGVIEKWYFGINQDSNAARLCHTKEELEKAGFGWVFDCEGIEIEEVEE